MRIKCAWNALLPPAARTPPSFHKHKLPLTMISGRGGEPEVSVRRQESRELRTRSQRRQEPGAGSRETADRGRQLPKRFVNYVVEGLQLEWVLWGK